MQDVSLFMAVFAGFASFVSPCVLPLVPAYVGYITGSTSEEKQTKTFTLWRAIAFVLGFSLVFIMMGATASYIGKLFAEYKLLFHKISGILIIVFGLHLIGLLKMEFLYKEARVEGPKEATSWITAVLMGMAFAAGWTPCVGPVLASILAYAGSSTTLVQGIILLVFYSLGLGIPFILTAVFIEKFMEVSNKVNKYLPIVSKVSGAVLIIFGILLFLNKVQALSQYFI
ncbi:cytochrome c biogenesis CcdA family protein [Halanaerobacter jeridensis]|uniref:Cytochrome c-type biogenesis protein n=1 Tax=Halanaerobacter jeridensis TaxID=706427 RepID=A0A938XUB6_9FIRM|nr:cytochrome c biogenesis protein CcdA [Halanaerobacter jeridensis]MBM7556466.1 cytochrome c-type biogenesis protein [Halanaerobacter jeridensis]